LSTVLAVREGSKFCRCMSTKSSSSRS
jgi:hypothetical protein